MGRKLDQIPHNGILWLCSYLWTVTLETQSWFHKVFINMRGKVLPAIRSMKKNNS